MTKSHRRRSINQSGLLCQRASTRPTSRTIQTCKMQKIATSLTSMRKLTSQGTITCSTSRSVLQTWVNLTKTVHSMAVRASKTSIAASIQTGPKVSATHTRQLKASTASRLTRKDHSNLVSNPRLSNSNSSLKSSSRVQQVSHLGIRNEHLISKNQRLAPTLNLRSRKREMNKSHLCHLVPHLLRSKSSSRSRKDGLRAKALLILRM